MSRKTAASGSFFEGKIDGVELISGQTRCFQMLFYIFLSFFLLILTI